MSLDDVCMSCSLYRIGLSRLLAMGYDRVVRSGGVWTVCIAAACDGHSMGIFSTAFRDHEVVPSVLLVDMRSFGISSACSVPYDLRLCELFSCIRIDLAEHYIVVCRAAEIAFSVFIPEKVRIDSRHVHCHRIRPCSIRILGAYDEVAKAGTVGRDHVECTFMVTDGRREYTLSGMCVRKRKLGFPVEDMADLLPVHEVLAMIERNTREIMEGACHHVVVISDTAYARVRIESFHDRVCVSLRI